MKVRPIVYPLVGVFALAGCGQGPDGQAAAQSGAGESAQGEFHAASGVYKPDPNHRYISFSYFHQGFSRPFVRWDEWDAALNWDAENPENSSVSVVIQADSVNSGVAEFNGHLKGEQFFDVENHPEITFESTDVARTGENTGNITGDLTIKGVSRPVTLDAKFNKAAYLERGDAYKMGFSANTTVKRSDFGMDYAIPAVTDEVRIEIEAEFVMPADSGE